MPVRKVPAILRALAGVVLTQGVLTRDALRRATGAVGVAYRQLRTDLLFAAVLAASVLGLVLFGAVSLIGARLLRRWHPSASGS